MEFIFFSASIFNFVCVRVLGMLVKFFFFCLFDDFEDDAPDRGSGSSSGSVVGDSLGDALESEGVVVVRRIVVSIRWSV